MSTPKGILDPWRVEDAAQLPATAGPHPAPQRTNVADLDRDEDLRVANRIVLRSEQGSIAVQSTRVASDNDALRELVSCLFELTEGPGGDAPFADLGIGFSLGDRHAGARPAAGTFSALMSHEGVEPAAALYFSHQPYYYGFHRLVRLLGAMRRRRGGAGREILKRWGVTPLLR
jgi:hypothetical protein